MSRVMKKGFPPEVLKDANSTRKYFINTAVDDLGWRVGVIYHDVVRTLLEGDLADDDDETLARAFFTRQYLVCGQKAAA